RDPEMSRGLGDVYKIEVFTTDGYLAGMASGDDSISLSHLSAGIYVVKAVTESGTATLKIAI
ncbi:MAG: T9SS type A sorting domain-containing protein, partial [Muribaculaceae bacterium]|nr:T9SS type A sorting domain-containing protein [Muribaculaceae bacterium]